MSCCRIPFQEGVFVFDQLKIGTELILQFEPENRYDNNAVAVYFKEHKIWYIPRNQNKEIARLLEAGYDNIFDVRINRVSPEDHPENQIGITIFLKNTTK